MFSESDLRFRNLICVFGYWFVFDPFGPPYNSNNNNNNNNNNNFKIKKKLN